MFILSLHKGGNLNVFNVFFISVEQVKGSSDLRQRIIKAAKEARKNKEYPIELQHDCHYISDKYNDHSSKILPPNHPPYPSLERKY